MKLIEKMCVAYLSLCQVADLHLLALLLSHELVVARDLFQQALVWLG